MDEPMESAYDVCKRVAFEEGQRAAQQQQNVSTGLLDALKGHQHRVTTMERLQHLYTLRNVLMECMPVVRSCDGVTVYEKALTRLTDRIVTLVIKAVDEVNDE